MFQHIKEHLRIYIDKETNLIKYAALVKTSGPIVEEERKYDIATIVKIQSIVRMILVRRRLKREFEGFITRFVMRDEEHKGRKARITVWKTLVEQTRKKKVTQKIKERDSRGNILSEEIK